MQMKILLTSILILSGWIFTYGQDGSDINYLPVKKVNSSLIGQSIYLDFYNRSFSAMKIDTVTIILREKPIRFIENRKDNGLNNWFIEQSLESLDSIDGVKFKILSWQLLAISKDSIQVKPKYELILSKGLLVKDSYFNSSYWFDKAIIKEVLVQDKPRGS